MTEIFEIVTALEIMEESYPKIRTLSEPGFLMFLGNLIDQWGADHSMNSFETCAMLKDLSVVQKAIHDSLGSAIPTL